MTIYDCAENAVHAHQVPDNLECEYRQVWRAKSGAEIECRGYTFWRVVDADGICHDFEDNHNAAWEKFIDPATHQQKAHGVIAGPDGPVKIINLTNVDHHATDHFD